jgi:hypothetical protein
MEMAFRGKEAAAACGLMLALVSAGWAVNTTVEVRHDHLRGEGAGVLRASDAGLRFQERGKNAADHQWTLAWADIQQLWVSPGKLRVLTYADVWWKLGTDREYELAAAPGASFAPLYSASQDRLDQRLVGAFAEELSDLLWETPVKRRERFGGPEGVLQVGHDRIVFTSAEKGKSRTWRLTDIENVSSSGPFDLTLTTFERSKSDYGSRKAFNFQLKQPLSESSFNALWRRLHKNKQIEYLSSIQEKTQQ